MEQFFTNQTFSNIDYKGKPLIKGEYEQCLFKNCDFFQADLSAFKFSKCSFIECNLSMVALHSTALREVKFLDSKMLGLHFDHCNKFGLLFFFNGCILNHSSFYQAKISKTVFRNTQLHEVDFSDCDLSMAVFDNCDLSRATFERTILEKADFRTSYNYAIDPEKNRIKNAKFALPGVIGLLDKYDIDIE